MDRETALSQPPSGLQDQGMGRCAWAGKGRVERAPLPKIAWNFVIASGAGKSLDRFRVLGRLAERLRRYFLSRLHPRLSGWADIPRVPGPRGQPTPRLASVSCAQGGPAAEPALSALAEGNASRLLPRLTLCSPLEVRARHPATGVCGPGPLPARPRALWLAHARSCRPRVPPSALWPRAPRRQAHRTPLARAAACGGLSSSARVWNRPVLHCQPRSRAPVAFYLPSHRPPGAHAVCLPAFFYADTGRFPGDRFLH